MAVSLMGCGMESENRGGRAPSATSAGVGRVQGPSKSYLPTTLQNPMSVSQDRQQECRPEVSPFPPGACRMERLRLVLHVMVPRPSFLLSYNSSRGSSQEPFLGKLCQ